MPLRLQLIKKPINFPEFKVWCLKKKNAAYKTVTNLMLFSGFKSISIFTGSKEAKSVNILVAEKFPKDTWWDHYLPDFQCSGYWSKFGRHGKRCLREWVLTKGRKWYSKIYMIK